MTLNIHSTKQLANGIEMPRLGLGVYKMTEPDIAIQAITAALDYGYRHIDTASLYANEKEVGDAIRASNVPRKDIFITTKVWNTDQGYDQTLRAFEKSLELLGMDYVDLYLTHWPVKETFVDTYRAIERLYDEKLIRATGVANHHAHHLEAIAAKANIKPMVNQIECHPRLTQFDLREYCEEQGIAITSWSPLARGRILEEPTLKRISTKYSKSTAQTIIRWHLQHDLIVIPKSENPSRIAENMDVYDFELSFEDMKNIDALNLNERTGKDPDNFSF
ncbi:aldo/keto reductase [Psychrobacillus psychrodurans]|uniref:Aldo/keto reductase n=1 Tax=Psychrobacillus psychrodurans TaxID=126157 RepID=A0A9X3L943_9BACI|nr:aldo/keto reductase [Psychrobacillus psychrodurans]MCZ8533524.1 aldo/keto reductase [Psychrobacillus psychrodurans]MCZ8541931.1 aldo/keto reductase [Psychrobacillus psychrodurans]SFN14654.1 Aldo/keto reductase [Psychrobacillus psychrodurans]